MKCVFKNHSTLLRVQQTFQPSLCLDLRQVSLHTTFSRSQFRQAWAWNGLFLFLHRWTLHGGTHAISYCCTYFIPNFLLYIFMGQKQKKKMQQSLEKMHCNVFSTLYQKCITKLLWLTANIKQRREHNSKSKKNHNS